MWLKDIHHHLLKVLTILILLMPGIVNAALIMHLPLDNNLNDASGNGNNGSLPGGGRNPAYANAVLNEGLNFDGNNDYITAGDFSPGSNFSVALWVRPDTSANIDTYIEHVRTNQRNDFFLGYDNALNQIIIELEDNNQFEGGPCGDPKFCTGINLTPNRWHHLTVVVTPTTLTLYVDSELAWSITHATTVTFNPGIWMMGADSDSNPNSSANSDYFDGRLDDIRVYSHALNQQEISGLMNLSGWWRLDECSLASPGDVIDNSGNNNNASPVNGTTTTTGGRICRSGTFDGTNDHIIVPHSAELNGTTSLTYSAWINPNDWSGSIRQIMAKSVHGGGSGRAQMGIFSEGGVLKGRAETTSGRIDISTTLPALSSWSQVTLVFNSTSLRLYTNGTLAAQTSFAATTLRQTTDELDISKRVGSAQYYFSGLIDEVKVFQRALTTEEINDYYTIPDPINRTCNICGVPVSNSVIISTNNTETLGGLTFSDGSLAEYDFLTNTASLFFDENLFTGNEDVDATHVLANGNIILSTMTTATLGGLNFRDGDLVEYNPVTNTATLFFSENLFSAGEDIDAVYVKNNGNIILSTTTSARLGGLNFRDGDLVEYNPISNTASLFFSENNFSNNTDIDGVHLRSNGNILISTQNTETLGGLTFSDGSIAEYNISTGSATLYFNENLFSSGADINAITRRPPVILLHHILIEHDGTALTCNPENITLRACANAACNTELANAVVVDLTPTGWVGGDSQAILAGNTVVQYRRTIPGLVTLSVASTTPIAGYPYECLNTSNASNSCDLVFYDSGFIYNVPTQTSCATSSSITIAAVRKDITTQQCIPSFANRSEIINFWSRYISPVTGTRQLTLNNGTTNYSLLTAAPGTGVSLNFNANGEATFTLNYPDAGQLTLNSSFIGSGTEAGLNMTGATSYANIPAKFYVYSDDLNVDCASGNISCSPFRQAGQNFNLKVRAACTDNTVTANFQHNGISIVHNLVAPTGGNPGTIGNSAINILPGDNGEHVVTDQSVSEVGVFTYTVQLNSSTNYLGETVIGSAALNTSANIGRFYPSYFDVTRIHGCAAGSFTYSGQPFTVTTTAYNANSIITQNYDGALGFARTATVSDSGDITNFSNNLIAATSFNTGAGTRNDLFYSFPLKKTAPQTINLRAIDTDNVSSIGRLEEATDIHSGRISISNAFGSEIIDLSVPTTVQHYDGTDFVKFPADACTMLSLSLSKVDGSLNVANGGTTGDTCVWDDAANSGANNCSAATILPGPALFQYIEPPSNADFNVYLKPPGVGFTGNVDVSGIVDSWLQFDWSGTGLINPKGRATFGIYRGDDRIIYWRERFD